jgi:hypothetical protein
VAEIDSPEIEGSMPASVGSVGARDLSMAASFVGDADLEAPC